MTVKDLKQSFFERLNHLYPSEEIHSFFSILADEWLGYNRFEAVVNADTEVPNTAVIDFRSAISRLLTHEPIQYIVGRTEFYGLPFIVNSATLIPRPETEALVDLILKDLKDSKAIEDISILDVGTGSGCIAIALAKELTAAKLSALDISEEALKVARVNAVRNKVHVHFFQQDITTPSEVPETFDIIVSNPPYVRELEKEYMQPNVLNFEPGSALFVSNDDPLLFYRAVCTLAKNHLRANGKVFFEINEYLGKEIMSLLRNHGFRKVALYKDFRGKDRMIKAERIE